MKKLIVAGIIATAFCSAPAIASDLPVKAPAYKAAAAAPYDPWTGCYIGGNIGGVWQNSSFTGTATGLFNGAGVSDGSHTNSGFAGGGQIGCDYQLNNNWVVGIQGMEDWSSATGSNIPPTFTPGNTISSKLRSFGMVTGSAGYLVDPKALVYGKAGYGWARTNLTLTTNNGAPFCAGVGGPPCTFNGSGTQTGPAIGVGLAWMVMPNWDLTVEYDHIFLGQKTINPSGPAGTFPEVMKQDLNAVLVGANYRFIAGR